MKYSDFRISV